MNFILLFVTFKELIKVSSKHLPKGKQYLNIAALYDDIKYSFWANLHPIPNNSIKCSPRCVSWRIFSSILDPSIFLLWRMYVGAGWWVVISRYSMDTRSNWTHKSVTVYSPLQYDRYQLLVFSKILNKYSNWDEIVLRLRRNVILTHDLSFII